MLTSQRGAFTNSDYPCTQMRRVWQEAKCWNFVEAAFADTDGFFTFIEYEQEDDFRRYPVGMECGGPGASSWRTSHLKALNADQYGVPANDLPSGYPFRDPLEFYFVNLIRPKLVPGACGPAISTGVEVRLTPGAGADRYPDGICTNPGCSYDGAGGCN